MPASARFSSASWPCGSNALRAAGLLLAAMLPIVAGGWLFVFAASGDAAAALPGLWRWGTLAALFATGVFVVTWLDLRERRGLDEWLAVDLHSRELAE